MPGLIESRGKLVIDLGRCTIVPKGLKWSDRIAGSTAGTGHFRQEKTRDWEEVERIIFLNVRVYFSETE